MSDLKDPTWMYAKAALLVLAGCLSAGLLLAEAPTLKVALLLGIAIWSFCRAYYFAFYVIERYIDSRFKFAGLASVARYLLRRQ
jgi:hypothetical protein